MKRKMSTGIEGDVGLWKQIAGWLWALLMIPLGILWRKADGAASKEEMKAQAEVSRINQAKLFENAEDDRRRSDDKFSKMQDTIHSIHTDVLTKLGKL